MSTSNGEIIERLDILIALLIPRFEEHKYDIKGGGLDVLKLCDGEHTVSEIAAKLNKSKHAIEVLLSRIRAAGYIKSVSRDTKTYYVRLT